MATDLSALDTALRLLAAGAGVVIGSQALQASMVVRRHRLDLAALARSAGDSTAPQS